MLTERVATAAGAVDEKVLERTVSRFREEHIVLPTFAQLADPGLIPAPAVRQPGPGRPRRRPSAEPVPRSLVERRIATVATSVPTPDHLVLPSSLTGVAAPIVVALGNRFPMIHAHKVLAAYGCLAPRVDYRTVRPDRAQGDLAVNRQLLPWRCGNLANHELPWRRGPARGDEPGTVRWLEEWVLDPADIIRTPGSESNVKEIYDACAGLERDPQNIIFNQFCEFGNYLAHYLSTGTRARADRAVDDPASGCRRMSRPLARAARWAPATT